jgi:hypothetical protein
MIRAIVMSVFSICLAQLALGQARPGIPGIDRVLKAMKDAHWANRSKGLHEATESLATRD